MDEINIATKMKRDDLTADRNTIANKIFEI
jgi:hypothetical protein